MDGTNAVVSGDLARAGGELVTATDMHVARYRLAPRVLKLRQPTSMGDLDVGRGRSVPCLTSATDTRGP